MPVSFKTETQAVLPPDMKREQMIEHIQKFETIIRVQPKVDHFERLDTGKTDHIATDPFFTKDAQGTDITTYEIHERLQIIPFLGISKIIKFPVYYQNFANGVRARVDAPGGTTVRATYVVRPLDGYDGELRRGAWRLVEESQVECSALVKPFVVKTFKDAHGGICQRLVDGLVAGTHAGNSSP